MKSVSENYIYNEENGLWYELRGEQYYPCLELPAKEERSIGIWGQRHGRYLREHRKIVYTSLLTSGKLNSCLADIDEQAQEMFLRLVEEMAKRQGVTEEVKAKDMMKWIGLSNNIRSVAMEMVLNDLIYN